MKKLKDCLELFLIFFKIGLFTFGGGYAMISLISHEIVEKKKYIDGEEFSDLVAIAESTPGPIAINSATYIGYKKAGVLGSIFASIGVVLPSLIIIYLISLFLGKILEYPLVQKAFNGIQCGVSVLIVSAGIKLMKNVKKDVLSYVLLGLSFGLLLVSNFLSLNISTIYYILVGAVVGLIAYYRPTKKPDNRLIAQDLPQNYDKKKENLPVDGISETSNEDAFEQSSLSTEQVKLKPRTANKKTVLIIVFATVSLLIVFTLLFFGGLYKFVAEEAIKNLSDSSFYSKFLVVCELFAVFFKIGLFSFGGGYGMLPLMLSETTSRLWLTQAEFANFLAVAESTPGPVSINMATYVGSTQGGLLGSVMATLGVITPSIIVILVIVSLLKDFLQYQGVRSALFGMKPVICGMILATGVDLALENFFPEIASFSFIGFSAAAVCITAVIALVSVFYKKILKKNASPIILIVISAVLGLILT